MDVYLPLMQMIASRRGEQPAAKATIAFTAASPGEGTSYVVHGFGKSLAAHTGKRVLIAAATRLHSLTITDCMRMPGCCDETSLPNLWVLPDAFHSAGDLHPPTDVAHTWQHEHEFSFSTLKALRYDFDFVLIDCLSLKSSSEASFVAPHVDGIVIVVEADRTRRGQIAQAQKALTAANGRLLGCVLNKRRYSIPEWLHRRL